jgi:hypothetical protein
MNPGDEVEVLIVWAYAWPEPLRSWSRGYVLEVLEGEHALVRNRRGLFAGTIARYPLASVRKVV